MKHRMMGFTLVELSLVLLALGLILPGAVIFWQLSERHRVTTVQMDVQQQSRDAVVGFLHANYRLPCPAADTLGVEKLARLKVPVPPLAVQQAFVDLQSTVSALKSRHAATRADNAALLPATLDRLFAGQRRTG